MLHGPFWAMLFFRGVVTLNYPKGKGKSSTQKVPAGKSIFVKFPGG